MKKYTAFIVTIAVILAAGFGISSCKDDEPPLKPKLSFADTEMTVGEDDGTIEVQVVLDKAYSQDINIEYELGGTASDQDVVGTANADYEVVGDHGVVVIERGETTGVIELEIYSDAAFEADETIEISILDTNTDAIEVTADDDVVITITNDDAQLVASFPTTAITWNEDDGIDGPLSVTVQLDKAPTSDVTVDYTLATSLSQGVALDSLFAANNDVPSSYYDYYVDGVHGKVTIPAGSTSGTIDIQLLSDFMFEDDEKIEITLTETNAVKVGTNNKATITVEQQDGKVIALVWEPTYTTVDMDMFLWIGPTTDNFNGVLATAITPRKTPQQELVFIPKVISDEITDAAFGLSLIYYEGTEDPMNFEVQFADYVGGNLEAEADRDVFSGTYTLANINRWDESETNPPVVQTFRIVNGEYVEISEITEPASGSRIRSQQIPEGLGRRMWTPSKSL